MRRRKKHIAIDRCRPMRHPQDHHLFYAMLAYERAWHRLSPEVRAKGFHTWLLDPPAAVLGLVEAIVDVERGLHPRPTARELRFARLPR